MLYYDIKLHIFVLYYSLNNGFFFLEILWLGLGLNQNPCPAYIKICFSPFLDDTSSQVVFQILCRRDLMNTLHKLLKICCYLGYTYRKW